MTILKKLEDQFLSKTKNDSNNLNYKSQEILLKMWMMKCQLLSLGILRLEVKVYMILIQKMVHLITANFWKWEKVGLYLINSLTKLMKVLEDKLLKLQVNNSQYKVILPSLLRSVREVLMTSLRSYKFIHSIMLSLWVSSRKIKFFLLNKIISFSRNLKSKTRSSWIYRLNFHWIVKPNKLSNSSEILLKLLDKVFLESSIKIKA